MAQSAHPTYVGTHGRAALIVVLLMVISLCQSAPPSDRGYGMTPCLLRPVRRWPSGPQSESPVRVVPAAWAERLVTCNSSEPSVTGGDRPCPARPLRHGPSADRGYRSLIRSRATTGR